MDDKVSEKSESNKKPSDYFIGLCLALIESQRFIKNTPNNTMSIEPTCQKESVSLKNSPIDTATTGMK